MALESHSSEESRYTETTSIGNLMHVSSVPADIYENPMRIDSIRRFSQSTSIDSMVYEGSAPSDSHHGIILVSSAGPAMHLSYRFVKRALDVFLVLLFSPLLLLVFGAIAAAIRLESKGPIFFSHRRIRKAGAFFSMWKFRTMCVNSKEVLEQYLHTNAEARNEWRLSHKLKFDPRITKLGRFLRRTSLDELPQLWNVITGDMSLVGPRPIVAAEVEKYGSYFADYCLVKPGITGLWQTSGRSNTSYDERVQLDRKYAHNWSLSGDIVILVKTLTSVVWQDGAY